MHQNSDLCIIDSQLCVIGSTGAAKLVEKELQGEKVCVWLAGASQVKIQGAQFPESCRSWWRRGNCKVKKFVLCVLGWPWSSQNPGSCQAGGEGAAR